MGVTSTPYVGLSLYLDSLHGLLIVHGFLPLFTAPESYPQSIIFLVDANIVIIFWLWHFFFSLCKCYTFYFCNIFNAPISFPYMDTYPLHQQTFYPFSNSQISVIYKRAQEILCSPWSLPQIPQTEWIYTPPYSALHMMLLWVYAIA